MNPNPLAPNATEDAPWVWIWLIRFGFNGIGLLPLGLLLVPLLGPLPVARLPASIIASSTVGVAFLIAGEATSEFDAVKARLRRIEDRNKLPGDKNAKDKPTLRTWTEGQRTNTDGSKPTTQTGDPSDDPDRPTLKKRAEDSTNP